MGWLFTSVWSSSHWGSLIKWHGMHVEGFWSQASHFMEEIVCWWRVRLCDLAPSPVPLCPNLA